MRAYENVFSGVRIAEIDNFFRLFQSVHPYADRFSVVPDGREMALSVESATGGFRSEKLIRRNGSRSGE